MEFNKADEHLNLIKKENQNAKMHKNSSSENSKGQELVDLISKISK